jgi:hypothetical protein
MGGSLLFMTTLKLNDLIVCADKLLELIGGYMVKYSAAIF